MTQQPLARDDAILVLLSERGPAGSVQLAVQLGFHERRIRRGLRKLIDGGYVFSPLPGHYRITAAGAAAIAPVSEPVAQQDPVGAPEPTPRRLYDRLRSRQ